MDDNDLLKEFSKWMSVHKYMSHFKGLVKSAKVEDGLVVIDHPAFKKARFQWDGEGFIDVDDFCKEFELTYEPDPKAH